MDIQIKNIEAKLEAEVVTPDHDIQLKPGEVGAILELIVTDKDGKVTEHRRMKSRSFLRQFIECLFVKAAVIYTPFSYDIRDTGNVLRSSRCGWGSGYVMGVNGALGNVERGIVVGTGNTAPTINDYALETLIAHGVGAGQLQYSVVSFGSPANDATTTQFRITRVFSNGSGGGITVNEVGLYAHYYDGASRYACIVRDVIAGGVLVPNGQALTINYQLQAVV